jgi:VWFA-related protein
MRLSGSLLMLLMGAAGQETPTFRSESQVVLLDMVVRDKQGRPITDLQSGEVEIFEDGSRCEIVSFRLVEAPQLSATIESAPSEAEPSAGPSPATPRSSATPARASLVVLVFDQLGIEAAQRVRQAADEFLSRPFPSDTWFAAIKIGQGLRLLQPFTTDPTRLPPAVERATRGGDVTRDAPIGAGGLASDSLTDQALDTLTQEMNRPTDQIGPPNVGAISGNMLFLMDEARRTQQGYGSLVPLISIAKSLQGVEGRKTVVYFSEGLQAPEAVQALFDTVIEQANRANMTVYSVDARGLTTRSPTETSRRMLDLAAGLSEQIESSSMKSKQGDVILAGLRGTNAQANMETLSLATGGFLIGSTNDLRPGLERVVGELSSYYEVVYVPPNPGGDGRFHRIETKVARRGVSVRTRSGYFATPAGSPSLLAHDLPLIAALEAAEPPRDFEHQAAALHFDPRGRERENLVLIEVPLAGIQLTPDESRGSYRARLGMLALVRDEQGRLVTRLSHDWPLEGPLDQVESARGGNAIFKRVLRLAPGRYKLETALLDRESGRVSTGRSSFEVPAADAGLALSSLAVLKRAESASSDTALAADPLRVDSVALVPNLGAPVAEGTREVSFFLRLFPAPALGPMQLSLEVVSGDEVIGRTNPRIPAPDEDGRIAWVGSLPAEGFSPGRYELRVTASQGTHVAQERATFEIVSRTGVAPVPASAKPTSPEPADEGANAILQTAGRYVLEYERAFRDLVAEESYIQVAGGPSGERRQVTRSDLVFVSTPGAVPWTSFRDVYEVNGQKVRDREARLEKLFRGGQTGDALAQADAIRAESSRYNIGPAVRNINVPTLALLFLHPQNQARFHFERKGRRAFSGIDAVEIEFAETRRPALVTDGVSEDLPAKGRFWIDPFRGTVLRSDVTFRFLPNRATARIAVDYRTERGLPIWVPSEMKEWYGDRPAASIPVFRGRTEGTARYSNYRRFTVTTEEKAEALPD